MAGLAPPWSGSVIAADGAVARRAVRDVLERSRLIVVEAAAAAGFVIELEEGEPETWAAGADTLEGALGRILVRACVEAEHFARPGPGPRQHPGPRRDSPAGPVGDDPGASRQEALDARREAVVPAPAWASYLVLRQPWLVGPPVPVKPVVEPVGMSVRRSRAFRVATWARNLGVVALVFVAYQLGGTSFQQARSQSRLRASFHALPSGGGALGGTSAGRAVPDQPPLPGGVVARLHIPAIGVDQYVVEGTGTDDLKKGPGHYLGSSMPGEPGNAAIAGHRTTYGAPFWNLDGLHPGDKILTETRRGSFSYTVSQPPFSVSPANLKVVNDQGDDRLTLTTCTPRFSARQRLIVVATLDGPAAPEPVPAGRRDLASRHLRVHAGTGWDLAALPLSLLWGAGLIALARLHRPLRAIWPRAAAWAVLAPLWGCGLVFLFEQLTRLLPPNV